ncbi:MAG: MFS transporter [Anaerolineaceae bacterium]|nr:MFS transporter [Anaerolineaceae bacterium]
MDEKKQKAAHFARLLTFRDTFASHFQHLATGGVWALSQPLETRRNLIWFWFDGLFASGSDNVVGTYLVVYLLALGATQAQIGLLSSLSSLSAAIMLLPGAWLVERIGRRRGIVLVGGGWARVALLLLAIMPFLLTGNALISVAIVLSISRDAMGNLSFPAWMSITGDIIPIEGRGRYFASRNFIMGITGMIATFLVGLLITRIPGVGGYQFALGLAFLVGSFSIFSFGHINDGQQITTPETTAVVPDTAASDPLAETPALPKRPGVKENLTQDLRELLSHPEFIQFAVISAFWNLSLNFAGPFFNVYLVKNLGANAAMVGLTAIASSISGMLIQYKLGELNDRWGARKLVMVSGLLIPILPLTWVFIKSAWYIIPINLLGGALWGAYNMGSFNYLLNILPQTRRARFSAVFQVVVTISLAIGAALGSLVVTRWGFAAVFAGSAIGRMAAALLFARLSTRNKGVGR